MLSGHSPSVWVEMNGRCELFDLIRDHVTDADADALIDCIRDQIGGQHVYIPASRKTESDRERALQMLRSGSSVEHTATTLGYHRTTIWRWWRQRKVASVPSLARDDWTI
jgi:transcriptional regulator of acetoin/glycerol metabolism